MLPAAAAKLLQSCPTLWDPIDGSPPGSPIPGILQARTLECVAIFFSNAWETPNISGLINFHDTIYLAGFWTLCTYNNSESTCEIVKIIKTDKTKYWPGNGAIGTLGETENITTTLEKFQQIYL